MEKVVYSDIMFEQQKLKLAAFLYTYFFPLYRQLYFSFKRKKDRYHLQLINGLVKSGATILDIGGNIGFYTRFLSELTGEEGKVYSFEPERTNFKHLENEVRGKSNVELIQRAVAAESGTLTLYTSNLLNVDHRTYKPENYSGEYSVEKVSIDDFVNDCYKVDFVKMDIQGFELDAFKGMEKTLLANRDIIIFSELWPYGLRQAGSSAVEVFDFLSKKGFNVYKVNAGRLEVLNTTSVAELKVDFFSDTNILACRNELIN